MSEGIASDIGQVSSENQISAVAELIAGEKPQDGGIDGSQVEEEVVETDEIEAEPVKSSEADGDIKAEEAEKFSETESTDVDIDEDWSLESLAEEVGLSVEDAYSTPIRFPDGHDLEPQTLGELKDFYIKNHRAASELQEKVKALDNVGTEMKAAQLAYQQHAPAAQAAKQKMEELSAQWESIQWDTLPEAQAKDYATQLRQGYQMQKLAYENAVTLMNNAESHLETVKQNELKLRQEAWQAQAAQQWPVIQEDNRWSSDDEAEAGMKGFYSALKEYGMSDEEAHMTTDARIFRILKDAMAYRKAGKTATKKRVKKVTKNVKAGGKTPQSVLKKRAQQRKLERAKGGDEQAKISIVSELINS